MKSVKTKAAVIFMTAVMFANLFLQTGCNTREAKDIAEIQSITEQFVETYASGNTKDMADLVDGKFSYNFNTSNKDLAEVILKFASKAKVEEFKSVEVDRKELKAKARVRLTYLDMYEFFKGRSISYMSKTDYLTEIDYYKDLSDTNLTFNYVFDEDEGRWLIKKVSAEKYGDLYDSYGLINIASISAEEARKAFEGIIDGLAMGILDQPYYSFNLEEVRVLDDTDLDNPYINEAAKEFVKAYYSYIAAQGYSIDIPDDYPYRALISGSAPSKEAILDYFSSDEHVEEMCMGVIRSLYMVSSMSDEEIWNQYYAETYYDLAKQIPYMASEEYVVIFMVDPGCDNPAIYTDDMVFPIYPDEVERAVNISDERYLNGLQKAAEALYFAGELSQQDYEEILLELENTKNSSTDSQQDEIINDNVIWEGTANYNNQAFNTVEVMPGWSDGSIVYGISGTDSSGVYMQYSKEPGWLNTAGYNLDNGDITVLLLYDHVFDKGTTLMYDWYVNGDHYGDSVTFTVEEDGTVEFEITMPDKSIPRYGTVEFRLWEEGHSHVIAYVSLIQT
jgi:hypothetical protein